MAIIIKMNRIRNALIGLIVMLIVTSGTLQINQVNAPVTNEFLIYDGQIVYDSEFFTQTNVTDDDIEWAMWSKRTEEVTVTNLDPDTIRFSKQITFEITNAYQQVGETMYTPESYGYMYTDNLDYVLKEFNDTLTHTATYTRDVNKTTGLRIRVENPVGQLSSVYAFAYYNTSGGYDYNYFYWRFGASQTHTNLYFENSTSVNIGDHTMWGVVSDFITIRGRRALVINSEEIPDDASEYVDTYYYDVDSGLQLGQERIYVTPTQEVRLTKTLRAQNVLDKIQTIPDLSLISPDNFLIYDGQVVYEEEYYYQEFNALYNITYVIQQKVMMTVTVTEISPDIIRFTQELRFKTIDAYQEVGGTKYTPESFGYQYRDEDDDVLKGFDDNDTHTATIIRDVSKTTGMRIRSLTPMDLTYVDALAYYEVSGGYISTGYSLSFDPAQTHSTLYFENSTSTQIGDRTLWGPVSDITNMTGRTALTVTDEDIPEDAVEYEFKQYFDTVSGLQLGREWTYVSPTIVNRHTRTLYSQTVLDTVAPVIDQPSDLTFETGTPNQMLIWRPSDAHPATYSIRMAGQDMVFMDAGTWDGTELSIDMSALHPGDYEFICYVSDESGLLFMDSVHVTVSGEEDSGPVQIPGFSLIYALFGLLALLWGTRRSKM